MSATTRRPVPCIVTERDILLSIGAGEDPDAERVGDHMSDGVIAAAPDWSLERAAAEMSRRGIRHLVVYDGSELVGVLSMRDIVRVWTSRGRDLGHDTRTEAAWPPAAQRLGGWIVSTGSTAPRTRCLRRRRRSRGPRR